MSLTAETSRSHLVPSEASMVPNPNPEASSEMKVNVPLDESDTMYSEAEAAAGPPVWKLSILLQTLSPEKSVAIVKSLQVILGSA